MADFDSFIKSKLEATTNIQKSVNIEQPSVWETDPSVDTTELSQAANKSSLCPVIAGNKLASDFMTCTQRAFNLRNCKRTTFFINRYIQTNSQLQQIDAYSRTVKKFISTGSG